MLRSLFVSIALAVLGGIAHGNESVRQFHAETTTPKDEIAEALRTVVGRDVALIDTGETLMISYSGNATPPVLASFFEAAFSDLSPEILAMGRSLSLTATLTEYDDFTDMSLMVLARFDAHTLPLPDGGYIMLDGTTPNTCNGQLVIAHDLPLKQAAKLYRGHFESEGYDFPDAEPDEVSFFIGYGPECELAMYLEPDRGSTLVVIRYLEE